MEKYEIQKLRDLPIEGVAEQMGIKVERHKALCPFHDDHHASLSFSTRRNSCRCYVCMGNSVGTIDLVMKYLGKDFLSACRWLAEVNGVYLEDGRKREGAFSSLSSEASSGGGSHSEKDSGGSHSGDDSGGSHSGKDSGGSHSGKDSGGSHSGMDSGGSHSGKDSGGSHSGDDSGGSHSGKSSSFDASRYARFFEHPWLNEAARRFLFEERKIDWRVVNWCRLTSWTDKKGINWLQIPYFDMDGRLIGIQNRNLDYRKTPTDFTDDTDSPSHQTVGSHQTEGSLQTEGSHQTEPMAPRFRFPYGARCSIYNLPVVGRLKPGEKLFITEGCSDCWAMLSAGHKAIAIPSATLLKPEDKQLLADIERQYQVEFHMFPDQDAPGEQLFLQLREILPHLVHHQLPPGCKDFSEYYLFKFCK